MESLVRLRASASSSGKSRTKNVGGTTARPASHRGVPAFHSHRRRRRALSRRRPPPEVGRQSWHIGAVRFIPRYITDKEVGELFTASDLRCHTGEHLSPTFTSPVLHEAIRSCDLGVACWGDGPEVSAAGIETMNQRLDTERFHAFEEYRPRSSRGQNAQRKVEMHERRCAHSPEGSRKVRKLCCDRALTSRKRAAREESVYWCEICESFTPLF